MISKREIMNDTKQRNIAKSAAKLLSALLILTFILLSFSSCLSFKKTGTVATAEQIKENIEKLDRNDPSYDYVCYYLQDYGIKNLDDYKFITVEAYFSSYYYKELPDVKYHAKTTAELFVDYYYPNIDLNDSAAVTDSLLYCYTVASGDRYAFYRNAEEYREYTSELQGDLTTIGIGVRVITDYQAGSILVTSVNRDGGAWKAGILSGDYIVAADGVTVKDDGVDAVMNAITGEEGTTVKVTVKRGEEDIEFSIVRAVITDVSVYYSISDGVGVIQIAEFNGNTASQFKEAVDSMKEESVKGVIFDMRNNPGGLLSAVVDVIDYIAPDGARIASYTASMEGTKIYTADDGHSYTEVPFVVLCNGYTASAGELFTASMRDYNDMGLLNASIVGEKTYGKGVMQSSIPFGDGSALTLTVAYYNPPCNVNYDGEGVEPDLPTESADIAEQMQTAKEELEALIGGNGHNGQGSSIPGPDSDVNTDI